MNIYHHPLIDSKSRDQKRILKRLLSMEMFNASVRRAPAFKRRYSRGESTGLQCKSVDHKFYTATDSGHQRVERYSKEDNSGSM